MSSRQRRIFWTLLVVGVAGRVIVAFATRGNAYDISSLEIVERALNTSVRNVYGLSADHWPYPPLFFVFIWTAGRLAAVTGLPFHGWIQVPQIAADVGIAWVVQAHLARRGATGAVQLAAAALVMVGPAFAIFSGYHGQIDALAILPALVAVVVWQDERLIGHRAITAGLLIGAGAALKTVPIVTLVALAPTVRSRRELALLVSCAIVVPLAALAPWLLLDGGSTRAALRYHGIPGLGGISLLAQPDLVDGFIGGRTYQYSSLSVALGDLGSPAIGVTMLVVLAVLTRARASATSGAVLVFLALYAFGINFFFQYLIWGMPFLLIAGHLRIAAAVQLAMLPPTLVALLAPWSEPAIGRVYFCWMTIAWVVCVVATVLVGRKLLLAPRESGGNRPIATARAATLSRP